MFTIFRAPPRITEKLPTTGVQVPPPLTADSTDRIARTQDPPRMGLSGRVAVLQRGVALVVRESAAARAAILPRTSDRAMRKQTP